MDAAFQRYERVWGGFEIFHPLEDAMRISYSAISCVLLSACASITPPTQSLTCAGQTNPVLKAKILDLEIQPDENLVVDGELWAAVILKTDLKVLEVIEGNCSGERVSVRLSASNHPGFLKKGDVKHIYLNIDDNLDDAPYAKWRDERDF